MVRPTKFDRTEALNTATEAFWKNGFEQSSVKNLSELLGMTRSSFYNAFGSRDALFSETIPEYAAQSPDAPLYKEMQTDVLPLITSVFQDICRARAQDPDARGCMIVNTVCEICPASEGLGIELAERILGSAAHLEHLLSLAQERGELSDGANVHALALVLQNLMIGINVLCKVIRDENELWLLTRTTLEGLGLYRAPAVT